MKTIVWLKPLYLVACFTLAQSAYGGEVNYKVGSYTFNMPRENVPDLSPWGWVKSVAVCFGSSLTELKHVGCSTQFLLNPDLMIDFSISLKNLKVQPKVMSFLDGRLSEWIK